MLYRLCDTGDRQQLCAGACELTVSQWASAFAESGLHIMLCCVLLMDKEYRKGEVRNGSK
jgi:hypothetical protein